MDHESLVPPSPDASGPRWLKWIPVASLVVSSTSLLFALGILYPWHLELSKEFSDLARDVNFYIKECQVK